MKVLLCIWSFVHSQSTPRGCDSHINNGGFCFIIYQLWTKNGKKIASKKFPFLSSYNINHHWPLVFFLCNLRNLAAIMQFYGWWLLELLLNFHSNNKAFSRKMKRNFAYEPLPCWKNADDTLPEHKKFKKSFRVEDFNAVCLILLYWILIHTTSAEPIKHRKKCLFFEERKVALGWWGDELFVVNKV